jgi:hypothetical protein
VEQDGIFIKTFAGNEGNKQLPKRRPTEIHSDTILVMYMQSVVFAWQSPLAMSDLLHLICGESRLLLGRGTSRVKMINQ